MSDETQNILMSDSSGRVSTQNRMPLHVEYPSDETALSHASHDKSVLSLLRDLSEVGYAYRITRLVSSFRR